MAENWQGKPDADNWVGTFHGAHVSISRVPDVDQINIRDIAHAIGNQCRFTGHVRGHYSVAEHCYHASFVVRPEFALEALLHDAQEAYIADLSTPMKAEVGNGYRIIEDRIVIALDHAFDMRGSLINLPDEVKRADRIMLMTERDALFDKFEDWGPGFEDAPRLPNWQPLWLDNPKGAREAYLHRFYVLAARRGMT